MENTPDAMSNDNEYFAEFESKTAAVELTILSAPAVTSKLSELQAMGADRATVLRLLALHSSSDKDMLTSIRDIGRKHLRLSRQLEDLASQLEKMFANPLAFSTVWAAFLLPTDDPFPDTDAYKGLPNRLTRQIREFAKALYWEDRKLRKLASIYPGFMSNWGLSALQSVVVKGTGNFHDDLLADLLDAAHQAVGSPAEFTGEGLRKFRQRHARTLIRHSKRTSQNLITAEMRPALNFGTK
jgi:hypothetical protein